MFGFRRFLRFIGVLGWIVGASAAVASADSGHARIVRVSLVQGDVRFAREVKGNSLTEPRGDWEAAVLNLPVRQGYVLATDNGRAEVEFENGALAFLAENTVLEFYDLSSEDGGFTTRLILRQGSAEFYVNPGAGDYFSVTGGDFSVQAEAKTTFRMNNFDDGSSVNVLHGRLTALANKKNTLLEKDQSLVMRAGEPDSMVVERNPANDEFDQWVAGRIDSARTSTAAGMQYSDSAGYTSAYTSGFGDLYTYGAWFPVAGYGNCWRPYGVGLGWSPFDFGNWYYDPFLGWSFLGSQPWGWLPYHYGGWVFRPGVGWVWSPSSSFGAGGVGRWRPVTGVWMRTGNGTVGIVPSHPLDAKGKTPLNLEDGMFAVTARGVSGRVPVENGERLKVENKPGREIMQNQLAETSAPTRATRTMASAGIGGGVRISGGGGESAIVYDRTERRFVNSNSNAPQSELRRGAETNANKENPTAQVPLTTERVNGRESQAAGMPTVRGAAPARPHVAPPSVPRAVVTERVFVGGSGAANAAVGGSARGGSGSAGSATSRSSAPAPSASTGPSSGSSARSSGSGGSGGGRPH